MGKNIAIFADGTGNTVGKCPTNVLRLCKMADIRNPHGQLVIYDPGVGTRATPAELRDEFRRPGSTCECNGPLPIEDSIEPFLLKRLAAWLLGLGFGYGTERNIKRLYSELAKHYEPGDRVYLFGFSRGAFTARALAGLIYRCGLVKRCHRDKIDEGYGLYRKHFEQAKSSEELRRKKEEVRKFREKYSHPCNIRFLGIFDTVKSVGYLLPKNLPHTRHNPIVQTVCHALSLHERRSFYAPTTWGGLDADTRPAVYVPACWGSGRYGPAIRWQDVKEVWFAGCHSDVGGGYPQECSSPADVSLRWMLEEARAHGLVISHEAEVNELATTITKGHLHDELARHETWKDWRRWIFWKDCAWWTLWRVVDRCPRQDLENEPPPPRKIWRYGSAGPRDIGASLRGGRIAVHSTALSCYEPKDYPWKGLKENLIVTEKYENSIAAEECGCRADWVPDI
ncbi:hypothetical protein CQ14_25770 [Bradyrhizobium lablabi]|uniref:T6SS Phospholipase effector Tle1-like catalytic domain-containing protein n=1 Tax=Bradyrhizobium lablabi TaxID=722472 RepID=A0A0R3MZ37_9BRAD|nr:DUF2235 domain-containing protein [Bradyrhizobium lablabi]KRR25083.1 hypothetical protein CQ14_25770 [Bradyrhizobium lablabi]